jgi:hypothetical protein
MQSEGNKSCRVVRSKTLGGGTGWDANRGIRHIERSPSNTLNHRPKHNLVVRILGTKVLGDTRLAHGHYPVLEPRNLAVVQSSHGNQTKMPTIPFNHGSLGTAIFRNDRATQSN